MRAEQKIKALHTKLEQRGITLEMGEVAMLRSAERVLHRWCEKECGGSNDYNSYCITRDETTGKPFMEVHSHRGGKTIMMPIADREAGALRRVRVVCENNKLSWYYQTDPRGCALYISKEPLNDTNYSSRGYAVCDGN